MRESVAMRLPRAWLRVCLFAITAWTAIAIGSRVTGTVAQIFGRPIRSAPFSVRLGSDEIATVDDKAKAEGLRSGDRLLTVEDHPFTGQVVIGRRVARAPEGGRLRLEVERTSGTTRQRLPLSVPVVTDRMEGVASRALAATLTVFLPTFCALLGLYVVFRRPEEPLAWLLLALLLAFGNITYGSEDPTQWPAVVRIPTLAFLGLFKTSWPLWMLLFGLYFPERSSVDRRWPWLKWPLLAPLAAVTSLGAIVAVASSEWWRAAVPFVRLLGLPAGAYLALAMLGVGAFFPLLAHKSVTLASPDSRRRLRLLWTGTAVSLTPLLVLLILFSLKPSDPQREVTTGVATWLTVPALLALLIFPLTLAYVIVVDRAMDVGVVIRQGLQYALTRNAVIVLQALVSMALVFGALLLAAEPGVNRPRRITFMAAGMGAVFWLQLGAHRLRTFVDRRFFREALDTERVLTELGEDVRKVVDTQALLDTVAGRLAEALHVPRVAALLEEESGYVLARSLGLGDPPPVRFAAASPVVSRLREEGKPLTVYPDDPRHWSHGLPEAEGLRLLHAQVLIPLQVKDHLLGLLSLGAKLSEAAYSPSDLRLLRSVGAQVGLALENARLAAAVATEVARRERINRELEIAREVQERLFPQDLPRVPGLDYAGRCLPARGVGGDYYDFLALPDGRLGLAIGDVSGKGVSAALLMASLQASLRGQTTFGPPDLAVLMSRVNRLICDASSANRYATFFYAQYDAAERRLDYVNAGHNAPVLLRADGGVERLDHGGPVVGLLEAVSYEAASVELRAGDVLVAYTDGLSEAMDPAGEEWGEERLIAAARASSGEGAAEMVERLVREAEAFAAGAAQHDDLTVVVARVVV